MPYDPTPDPLLIASQKRFNLHEAFNLEDVKRLRPGAKNIIRQFAPLKPSEFFSRGNPGDEVKGSFENLAANRGEKNLYVRPRLAMVLVKDRHSNEYKKQLNFNLDYSLDGKKIFNSITFPNVTTGSHPNRLFAGYRDNSGFHVTGISSEFLKSLSYEKSAQRFRSYLYPRPESTSTPLAGVATRREGTSAGAGLGAAGAGAAPTRIADSDSFSDKRSLASGIGPGSKYRKPTEEKKDKINVFGNRRYGFANYRNFILSPLGRDNI